MSKVKRIVIHHSASDFGSASLIRDWHMKRGWRDIGYHFVICNSYIQKGFKIPCRNGLVEVGRLIDGDNWLDKSEIGAHVYGYNKSSIGICMIGNKEFTSQQMKSLVYLCSHLCRRYSLASEIDLFGHYELNPNKPDCPGFDMEILRARVSQYTDLGW